MAIKAVNVGSVADRIRDAKTQANTAHDVNSLDFQTRKGIAAMSANDALDDEFREINSAQTAVTSDPLVRYTFILEHIRRLTDDPSMNPDAALAAIFMATASMMPASKLAARPVLLPFNRDGAARDHARNCCGQGLAPIVLPNARRKKHGITQEGERYYTIHNEADFEAYGHLKVVRERGAKALVTVLKIEHVFDISEACWMALWLFDGAKMLAGEDVGKDYKLEGELARHKATKTPWRYYRLSQDEWLLLPNSVDAKELVERLAVLRQFNHQFNEGKLEGDSYIVCMLERKSIRILSPSEFIDGEEGQIAVAGEVETSIGGARVKGQARILFERLADGRWRTTFFNRAACAILKDDRNSNAFRYHWWQSPQALPEFLKKFLRDGTPMVITETQDQAAE